MDMLWQYGYVMNMDMLWQYGYVMNMDIDIGLNISMDKDMLWIWIWIWKEIIKVSISSGLLLLFDIVSLLGF